MKASDWIIDFFISRRVDTLYGYIGGMVTHLVDSASRHPRARFIQTCHEQSAAFAAQGHARARRLPGVAIATSGPGATNLLTGVADAYFDSVPMIYLTGQVNTYEYKYDKPIRQQGFQETDIVAMARPVTKYAVLLDRPEQLCYEFEKAWHIAVSGRPGPVLIDLPMDIQRAEIDPDALPHFDVEPLQSRPTVSASQFTQIISELNQARRPLLLIGGGARDAGEPLRHLLKAGLPAVVSLMGKGCVDESLPGFVGMIGSYGNRCANFAVGFADLLLVVGSRLDVRQTGACRDAFIAGKTVLQIDIDPAEMKHHRLKDRMVFEGDATDFLTRLAVAADTLRFSPEWTGKIADLRQKYSQEQEIERFVDNRLPYDIMSCLNAAAGDDDIFVADVGQNQMWAAQMLRIGGARRFMTSGGMASMGYAVPVAAGAAMADGQKQIWAVTGDGGLQIALQSLPLIAQYRLPVRVLVMNNASLGMITQFQSLYFKSNFAATVPQGGYCPPDCAALAAAFQLPYLRVETVEMLRQALTDAPAGVLIEVVLPGATVVSPKVEYTQLFYEMSPSLPESEMAAIKAEIARGGAPQTVKK